MEKRTHNPTPWLQGFGLNHAVEVSGGERTLYLSGQTSSAPDGSPLHPGDMVAQYKQAWRCVLDALAAAGMDASNLVRLNFYTTDVPAFMEAAEQIMRCLWKQGQSWSAHCWACRRCITRTS